jgi:hypothetical protein
MSALVPVRGLADSLAELFAPVDETPIATLLAEYAGQLETIGRVASVFKDERAVACLPYWIRGNDIHESYDVERMFGDEYTAKAIKALDASYWERALDVTDVLSVMPAKRREEWRTQLRKCDVPTFTEDAIRATLREHLAARDRYFAERVDGLFRALSPDHKTNIAAGFRSKMIIQHITGEFFSSTSRVDYLVDLRVVVARFMGRTIEHDYHVHNLTSRLIEDARRNSRGEWVSVDGGAIEIRLYANGNCHVKVHEELAWRLNAVLASVNPGAIPESNRTRPAYSGKRRKAEAPAVDLMLRPLPFVVLKVLSEYHTRSRDLSPNEWECSYHEFDKLDKHVRAEVMRVLASIGAVEVDGRYPRCYGRVRFDYDATDVLRELIASGVVPDQRAHQFYPTPANLAARVVDLAEIGPDDIVLEPSAGQGAIAELLPKGRTVCVEASALHCAVLQAKGLAVEHADFLEWHPEIAPTRVVMNPPFDRMQWERHVEHAACLLAPGGRLVSILPASARHHRMDMPGLDLTWSEPIDGAFAGTSISVVILVAEK